MSIFFFRPQNISGNFFIDQHFFTEKSSTFFQTQFSTYCDPKESWDSKNHTWNNAPVSQITRQSGTKRVWKPTLQLFARVQ